MATAQINLKSPAPPMVAPNVVRLDRAAPILPEQHRDAIFDVAHKHAVDRRIVPAGAELFAEGEVSENLYVVLDGWLFLHRILEDGRRQILDFALRGAVLGYRGHAQIPFTFSVEAVTNAEVAVIPISRVNELFQRGSTCAMTLLDATNNALLGAFDNLTDVGRRTAREAVAHFLLRMDRRIRRTSMTNGNDPIPFPLTQEHIGDALGLTAVHVCRTLRALRADGLIETGRGRLNLLDREALANEAGVFTCDSDDTRLAS
ncbi:MAG: Crp/Fnr family transcriptional regulator [Rhodospirillaceae bacterium]|nr:Crp/Fnr family transcriptional regulator [Rhodospirillaceae bacterium]MBT5459756.1 Crp/Fnr family transcriptional regulator [Rhodospirillaceae bacterium]